MVRGSTGGLGTRPIRRILRMLIGIAAAAVLTMPEAGSPLAKELPLPQPVEEPLQAGGQIQPTPASARFCEVFPAECAVDLSEPAVISLSPDLWSTIVQVNERVNTTILSVTDQDHWGVADRWDYPDDGMGDCEDIQLLKRRLLSEAGLPKRAMRMTVVIDEQGAGHAVMMIRTDHGDFILDNKRNPVLPWKKTGYVFLKREGTDSAAWVALGGQQAPIITANR